MAFSRLHYKPTAYMKTEEIIAWYQPEIDMESATSHLEAHCPSTCMSFLADPAYLEWRSGSVPVLWAYGQPGAGKTVLSSVVLKNIESSGELNAAISYHFFSSDRPKESFTNVLRHLIVQALHSCDPIPQEARHFQEKKQRDLTTKDLIMVLKAIACSVTTYVILDGLDEFPFLNELLPFLLTLQGMGIRLFVTSRDLPKIRKLMGGFASLEVAATSQDLSTYVEHRLQHGEIDLELVGEQLMSEIASAITNQAAGSYVYCLDEIAD
ncbi:hypothetical protein IL306_013427 [Fusarium sp. DS 682]|nr:hypothetical protein IL306_013427 [Fusarium sp. DS 682]